MTDWPVKTLGEVCEVLDNLRKPITKRDRTSGDYPYYGATGIVDHVGDYIFDEPLVLVGEDGAKWGAGERTAFIAEGKYWVNNHAHVLRCKQGVLVDSWLANFLTMSDLNRYVSGLTVPKLNQGSLVSIEIPVPPLEEQKRIVALLDNANARVSELTACYEQARTLANNLFTSALREALESDPNWPMKTLEEVLTLSYGKPLEPKDRDDKGAIPVYGANGVKAWSKRSYVNGPSIIVGRKGSAGELNFCDGPFWPLDVTYFVEHDEHDTDLMFLHYLLSLMDLPSLAKGVKPGINRNDVYALQSAVPPLNEQKRIVTRLDAMRAKTSEMVATYDTKLTAAKNLRQSILESAFEGKF